MKKKEVLPLIERLIEIVDAPTLSLDDLRVLHRLKNIVREERDECISSNQIKKSVRREYRGIAL